MTPEELRQMIQNLWLPVTLAMAFSCAVTFITSATVGWIVRRQVSRECQILKRELKTVLDTKCGAMKQELRTVLDRKFQALDQESNTVLDRECQALRRDLKMFLDQASEWPGRAAALYPCLADLIDDKLSLINQPNGHHE